MILPIALVDQTLTFKAINAEFTETQINIISSSTENTAYHADYARCEDAELALR